VHGVEAFVGLGELLEVFGFWSEKLDFLIFIKVVLVTQ
jgi:hypothetical protein